MTTQHFSTEFYNVLSDCTNNNYTSAAHKIKMFGDLHGTYIMLSFVTAITATLNSEQQSKLSVAFYEKSNLKT